MPRRSLVLIVTLLAATAIASSARGQARVVSSASGRTPPSATWTPPLGPDGHPDLQGVWLNNSATPLERPKALEGKATLSDEEVARLRQRAARLFNNADADFAAGDAVFLAALNDIETFKSTTSTGTTGEMIEREFDNRTSLIVDPPDGRIPQLTENARQKNAATVAIVRLAPRNDRTANARSARYSTRMLTTHRPPNSLRPTPSSSRFAIPFVAAAADTTRAAVRAAPLVGRSPTDRLRPIIAELNSAIAA